jgi:hypothetical protein
MSLLFDKFGGNPFLRISCTDFLDLEPFIELETSSYLRQSVTQTFTSQWSLHVILKGENGTGKTAHLLYMGKLIREQHSPKLIDDYVRGIEDVFKSPFFLFKHILERLNEMIVGEIPLSMFEFQKKLKEVLGDRKYFFLVDVPDSLNKKHIDDFVNTLEFLIGVQNVSIIIAMNISHYEKSFSYSEILGKFNPVFLKRFTYEDTYELVEQRLNTVSTTPNGIEPFTEDAVKTIQRVSDGVPRLILTKCDKLFSTAVEEHISRIDQDFAEVVLEKTHVMDTLNQSVPDSTMRKTLIDVFNILKNDMGGVAKSQKEFIEKVKEKGLYNNHITILKKIAVLKKLHIIKVETDPSDMKSMIYRCVV